jgi:hypothetical protein
MPRHELLFPAVLTKEMGGKKQEVRPDEGFHRIEDLGMGGKFEDEIPVEVTVQQPDAALLSALYGFQLVKLGAITGGIRRIH